MEYGSIWAYFAKERTLISRIKDVQRCLERYHSRKLISLDKELRSKPEGVLDSEELL